MNLASLSDATKSLLTGGIAVGVLLYAISSAMQATAIYHIAKKGGFSTAVRTIFILATVIIPFGLEVCLLIIAFDKKERKTSHSAVS